jgi:DNA ligase-1
VATWKHLKPPSEAAKPEQLTYPLLASPKLDGIRASCQNGQFTSNSGRRLPNDFIQGHYKSFYDNLDGELIVGSPTHPNVFNITSSGVRKKKGEPDFKYYVFDHKGPDTFEFRYAQLQSGLDNHMIAQTDPWIKLVTHTMIFSIEEMLAYEADLLEQGYEGVIARALDGKYKHGRATFKQAICYKIKRFADTEGIIVGFEEQLQNLNEKTVDDLGFTKRSSHKANKVGKGTTGKILVVHPEFGQLSLGPGSANDYQLQHMWDNQEKYIDKIATFKYFAIGMKDKPRMPIFKGLREAMDIG